jgi:hypothetical protein
MQTTIFLLLLRPFLRTNLDQTNQPSVGPARRADHATNNHWACFLLQSSCKQANEAGRRRRNLCCQVKVQKPEGCAAIVRSRAAAHSLRHIKGLLLHCSWSGRAGGRTGGRAGRRRSHVLMAGLLGTMQQARPLRPYGWFPVRPYHHLLRSKKYSSQ